MSLGRTLLYIPARGGSKGLPGKNLRRVGGCSLVGRAVLAARRWRRETGILAARIFLDTDDPVIAREGERWGAWVPFLRPPELAGDDVATIDTVLGALAGMEALGERPETLILLQPTSPVRAAEDIAACVAQYDRHRTPSVVSVTPAEHPAELVVHLEGNDTVRWSSPPPGGTVRRQAFPASWYVSGAVYVASTALLRSGRAWVIDGVTRGVRRPRAASVDVDSESDLTVAGRLAWDLPGGVEVEVIGALPGPVHALGELPELLNRLDHPGEAAPPIIVLGRPSEARGEMAPVRQSVALWRWATGVAVGWLHDEDDHAGTVAAVCGGASTLVAPGLNPEARSRLAATLTNILAEVGQG